MEAEQLGQLPEKLCACIGEGYPERMGVHTYLVNVFWHTYCRPKLQYSHQLVVCMVTRCVA